MIIGLDFGRALGIAAVAPGGAKLLWCTTWHFRQDHHGIVCYAFMTKLRRLVGTVDDVEGKVTLVAYEDLHSMGGTLKSSAWRSLWYGFRTTTWLVCEMAGTGYLPVPIHEWHKTGQLGGRPTSEELMFSAMRALPIPDSVAIGPCNDNEAAAVLVALTAARRAVEVPDA